MKYSQTIGIIATLALVAVCFLPWSFIESKQITVSGFSSIGTNYGKPGLMHLFLSVLAVSFFAIPKIWAKRTNMFVTVFNFAWSVRNFIVLSSCFFGECPERKAGLYLAVSLCAIMLLTSLFPKIRI